MKNKRAYLCNGLGCEQQCAVNKTPEEWARYPCHHIYDERFAKNTCRRKRKFVHDGDDWMEVETKK